MVHVYLTGQCQAADRYAEQLKETINHSVPKGRLAGFFAEPIQVSVCVVPLSKFCYSLMELLFLQGVGGTIQYPNGFLKKAYEIVRESGGLCVADEVGRHTR